MSSKLFVGGLAWATTDASLKAAFAQFGEVIDAKVITDRETGRSRGFGFVTFAEAEQAREAMQQMDGKDLDGRSIRVNEAQERSRGPGGGGGDRRGPPPRREYAREGGGFGGGGPRFGGEPGGGFAGGGGGGGGGFPPAPDDGGRGGRKRHNGGGQRKRGGGEGGGDWGGGGGGRKGGGGSKRGRGSYGDYGDDW